MSVGSKILITIIILFIAGLLSVVVRLLSDNSQLPFLFFIPLIFILFAVWRVKQTKGEAVKQIPVPEKPKIRVRIVGDKAEMVKPNLLQRINKVFPLWVAGLLLGVIVYVLLLTETKSKNYHSSATTTNTNHSTVKQSDPLKLLNCSFITDGTGKSNGLKISIAIPCDWQQFAGDKPSMVKKFLYETSSGHAIGSSLDIKGLPVMVNDEILNELLSQKGLETRGETMGSIISAERVRINGIDGGRIVFKAMQNLKGKYITAYLLYYILYYQNKQIVISYMAYGNTEQEAMQTFEENTNLFENLISQVSILDNK